MSQIDWPPEWERTPASERTKNRSYEVTLHDAITDLDDELGRLGVDDCRLSTAMDHQSQNPNYPYANQPEPDDPGVVCRWSMDGEQFAVAWFWDVVFSELEAVRVWFTCWSLCEVPTAVCICHIFD